MTLLVSTSLYIFTRNRSANCGRRGQREHSQLCRCPPRPQSRIGVVAAGACGRPPPGGPRRAARPPRPEALSLSLDSLCSSQSVWQGGERGRALAPVTARSQSYTSHSHILSDSGAGREGRLGKARRERPDKLTPPHRQWSAVGCS